MRRTIPILALVLLIAMTQTCFAQMRFGLGAYAVSSVIAATGTDTFIIPTVKFPFSDVFNGEFGLLFQSQSTAGASTTTFTVLGRGEYIYSKPLHLGGLLRFFSQGNTSAFMLSGLWGAKAMLTPKFEVGFDIYPISFISSSTAGQTTTTFSVLSGALFAHLYL